MGNMGKHPIRYSPVLPAGCTSSHIPLAFITHCQRYSELFVLGLILFSGKLMTKFSLARYRRLLKNLIPCSLKFCLLFISSPAVRTVCRINIVDLLEKDFIIFLLVFLKTIQSGFMNTILWFETASCNFFVRSSVLLLTTVNVEQHEFYSSGTY